MKNFGNFRQKLKSKKAGRRCAKWYASQTYIDEEFNEALERICRQLRKYSTSIFGILPYS